MQAAALRTVFSKTHTRKNAIHDTPHIHALGHWEKTGGGVTRAAVKPIIQTLQEPLRDQIATDVESFLHQLTGPTLVRVTGKDSSRTRAISTLLHGNEPSGVRAVHRWLRSGEQPAVNIICLIASVQAALHEELFKHRMILGQRDLNRCFLPPFEDYPGKIASHFLHLLQETGPECMIDIHNTSGSGPAFGVTLHNQPEHRALISLFTRRMVVTDYRLGSIMEHSDARCPVVTIECGGSDDLAADELAYQGLQRFLFTEHLVEHNSYDTALETYVHPIRLELADQCILAFDEHPVAGADLTVPPTIEQYNFGVVQPDSLLAWLGEGGAEMLRAISATGANVLWDYFVQRDGALYTRRPLKLFMVTSNATIGISDCLLYAANTDEPPL